jgi:hypothetical protein
MNRAEPVLKIIITTITLQKLKEGKNGEISSIEA